MQNRINWIDVVRGIGILLVILGHCQNPLFYLIFYAFHMPLFFFISGYCTSNTRKGYKNYLYLIKEYFVWTIINLLLQLSLEMYQSRALFTEDMLSYIKKSLIGIIYSAPSMDWLPVCTPLWFLPCVFLAKIIFEYVLRHEKAWRLVILFFVLGVFCSYIKVPYFETLPWNINVAFLAQIYMYIGYLYRQNSVLEKLNGIKAFCFGVLGVIGASINGQVNLAGRLFGKSILI
ncbi:MAG: acyltransferase family protein [Lachnospiraceae bacterium]|nr:acyltransferase family protein [Lachnospiraceae bacterium]MDD7628489.1 acyltransferase family protein [Lachnospiraceae bacterium]MDY4120015.1 acyltransferase family protein [Lachnospiraceae bacterium]